ncbi:hypothetical protein OQA88_4314 [Cercophora sp. LCS_1]
MHNVTEFKMDRWIQEHASSAKVSLHGSNIGTLSLSDLQKLDPDAPILDSDLQLSYGPAQGSIKLRERIAALYSSPEVPLTAENVVVTPGSIMANYLTVVNLASPGDHIIVQYPIFPQLLSIPKFHDISMSLWKLKLTSTGWEPDLDELKSLIRPNTKAIIIKYFPISFGPGLSFSADLLW